MKRLFQFPFLLITANVFAQTSQPNLYEVSKPFKQLYVDKHESFIVAFDMGRYLDKAGVGSSIEKTDTLFLQLDKSYQGKSFKVQENNNQLYIAGLNEKKLKHYKLEIAENTKDATYHLNNAYYLDNYFAMADRLNRKFELNHYDFRNGFANWEKLPNKEMNYLEFRKFTDKTIREIEDSISKRQEYLTTLIDYLVTNAETLDYLSFKDSLSKMPAEFPYKSSYYKTVINRISKSTPELVVSLYKDFPHNRILIELAVEKDKALLQRLKAEQKNEMKLTKKK